MIADKNRKKIIPAMLKEKNNPRPERISNSKVKLGGSFTQGLRW
jgi:hypothetical protein